jgi:hypothetical protein
MEPRSGDVTKSQQQVGGDDRMEQLPPEEVRIRRRPAGRRKAELTSIAFADERRRVRIAICLVQDRGGESHRASLVA